MVKLRTLLIDGDMLAYRNAAAIESEQKIEWEPGLTSVVGGVTGNKKNIAISRMRGQIEKWISILRADNARVFLSDSDTNCFRTRILPTYKGNRKDKVRPALLPALKESLMSDGAEFQPTLEADDLMGIAATNPATDGTTVVVTLDKDLLQIPGLHYNPFKPKPEVQQVDRHGGDANWMMQVLCGDTCDGYKGCPGIGPVRALELLGVPPCQPEHVEGPLTRCAVALHMKLKLWPAVVSAFISKGLTEADALIQARVSRILRHGEYTKKGGVVLWQPPQLSNTEPSSKTL